MKLPKPFSYAVCVLCAASVLSAQAAPTVAAVAKPAAAVAPKPLSTVLKIASLNGKLNPNHKSEIQMRPGERVALTADLFATLKGKLVSQKASAQEFVWKMDKLDSCDMARGSCESSGFEVSQEGVSFVLPENMAETVKIKVSLASDPKKSDSLVIRNKNNVEFRAEEARIRAEEEAEEARYQEQLQQERNAAIVQGIFGLVVGGLTAYGNYKAEEQRQERREEFQRRREEHRQQWQQRHQNPQPSQPGPVVAPPAPVAPTPAVDPTPGPRGDGQGRGPRGQH